MTQKNTGIRRIIRAFGYSVDGLLSTFRTEAAFRQEVILCIVLAPVAFWLAPDRLSLALMLGSLLLVLIVEVINSGLEAAVDRSGSEIHPLAKKAKDAGSAAVLLSLINVAMMWFFALIY